MCLYRDRFIAPKRAYLKGANHFSQHGFNLGILVCIFKENCDVLRTIADLGADVSIPDTPLPLALATISIWVPSPPPSKVLT